MCNYSRELGSQIMSVSVLGLNNLSEAQSKGLPLRSCRVSRRDRADYLKREIYVAAETESTGTGTVVWCAPRVRMHWGDHTPTPHTTAWCIRMRMCMLLLWTVQCTCDRCEGTQPIMRVSFGPQGTPMCYHQPFEHHASPPAAGRSQHSLPVHVFVKTAFTR